MYAFLKFVNINFIVIDYFPSGNCKRIYAVIFNPLFKQGTIYTNMLA